MDKTIAKQYLHDLLYNKKVTIKGEFKDINPLSEYVLSRLKLWNEKIVDKTEVVKNDNQIIITIK